MKGILLTLSIAVQQLHKGVAQIHKDVSQVKRKIEHDEHRFVLTWLISFDYSSLQNDFLKRREPGTGQWLLSSTEYETWLENPGQVLFCPGILGAGKTTMASIIVDDLCGRFRDQTTIGIAFVYFMNSLKSQQSAVDIFASLVRQLTEFQPTMPASILELYKKHSLRQTRPSLDELSAVFQSLTKSFSQVFIIIDALDECEKSNASSFLETLLRIHEGSPCNILVTSKNIHYIARAFQKFPKLEIRANEADVEKYLRTRVSSLPAIIRRDAELQKEIIASISKAANGMYVQHSKRSFLHF